MTRPLVRLAFFVALLLTGYLAGTLAPQAAAEDTGSELVRELKGIRTELQGIRRALEKH
jgi:hypothetical protein